MALTMAMTVFVAHQAKAQIDNAVKKQITLTKTSLSGTDTATADILIDNTVVSVELIATKTSGTVAGMVYLWGYDLKGTNKVKVDSLTVTNISGDQWNLITIPERTKYSKYSAQFLSTGGVWVPKLYNMRRP